MIWKTAEDKVGIRRIDSQTLDCAQILIELISVSLHPGTTHLELVTVLRCMAQEGFGKSIEIPNGQTLTNFVRKREVGSKQVADPQTADTIGFTHTLEDREVGVSFDIRL